MSRMLISMTLATISLFFAAGCSSESKKKAEEDKVIAASRSQYTAIEFEKGRSILSATSKEHLKALAKTWATGPSQEVKVLAWADEEYPNKVEGKASPKEVILASDRARAIKEFLKEELKAKGDVDSYNMAKRPNLFSKVFQNEEYKLKESFEASGATGVKLDDGSVSYSKAGKAIVIIEQ